MGNKTSSHVEKTPNYDLLFRLFESSAGEYGGQKFMLSESLQELLGFPEPFFSNLLFEHLINQEIEEKQKTGRDSVLSRDQFIHGMEVILQLGGVGEDETTKMTKFYIAVFCKGSKHITADELWNILNVSMSTMLAISCVELESVQPKTVQSMAQSLMADSQGWISDEEFCRWTALNSPRLFSSVHSWIHRTLMKSKPLNCPAIPFLQESVPESHPVLNYDVLWSLSTVIPPLYLIDQKPPENPSAISQNSQFSAVSSWSLLYSSHEHGQSMNRFKHHCLSYRGPTVMMLSTDRGIVLAVCVDIEWRDSAEGWGGKDCMLVQVLPEFRVLQRGEKMMFLNEKLRGLPTGLGIGTPLSKPKVFMETDMCSANLNYLHQDTDIKNVEVWGCGGQEAETAQKRQQTWEKKQAEKMRKVRLPGQWDENPDRAILEMAGITVSHAQR